MANSFRSTYRSFSATIKSMKRSEVLVYCSLFAGGVTWTSALWYGTHTMRFQDAKLKLAHSSDDVKGIKKITAILHLDNAKAELATSWATQEIVAAGGLADHQKVMKASISRVESYTKALVKLFDESDEADARREVKKEEPGQFGKKRIELEKEFEEGE